MRPLFLVLAILIQAMPALGGSPQVQYTQAGMAEGAGDRLRAAEAEMMKALGALTRRAEGKADTLQKLQAAQAAWETYRDAQLEAQWPSRDKDHYGSALPMCFAEAKVELTELRTQELKAMLTVTEGDVCSPPWPE